MLTYLLYLKYYLSLGCLIYNTLPKPFTDYKRLLIVRVGGRIVQTAHDQCTGKVLDAGALLLCMPTCKWLKR